MNTPLFPNGITGLSDTKFSGSRGNAYRLVGVDFRSEPGVIKAHQKLKKISGSTVTELCKDSIDVSDGSKLWFSSESGKIWRQVGDAFTLIHTVNPVTDYKEPNSIVSGVFDDPDNETGITMSIAENDAVYGTFDSIDSAIDVTQGIENSLINLDDTYYILAYAGAGGDGYLQSFTLNSTTGAYTPVENFEHDTDNGRDNSLCRIDNTHFILAYNGGASQNGIIKTFSGTTVFTQIGNLTHDSTTTGPGYNSLIQLDATHYALAYSGGVARHGYIKIFTVDGSYGVTQTSQLIHDSSGATYGHKLIKIDSTHLMLAYTDNTTAQKIKTFSIDGSYNVTEIYSLSHLTTGNIDQGLTQIDATHYAWIGLTSARNLIKVFTIDGSYNITETFSLDVGSSSYSYNLIRTDDTHLLLVLGSSLAGTIKSFEINSSFELRELSSYDYSSLNNFEVSVIRAGRRILVVFAVNGLNYLSTITMTETYANGIVLNPSGTDKIKLIASTSISQKTMSSNYLKKTIKIPSGYSNLEVVVIAGRAVGETYPPLGATVAGNAMTQIVNRTSAYGFKCSSAYYSYVNPTVGDSEISVDFGGTLSYTYAIILVFKNVHQTTPYSTTIFDYGWKDYLKLPGDTNNQLRIGAFLSKVNPHYQGELQDTLAINEIAEETNRYTLSVSCRDYNIGTAKILSAEEFSYTQQEVIGTETIEYKPEEQISKIYYTNESVLFAVPIDKITDWANNIETIGVFHNGDDTYHSMVKQNLELFIGDKIVLAKVNTNGTFIQETSLNIASPERIQVLSTFDTDILIGTKDTNRARVLRWDTFSDSWLADDDVMETGINAFIKDDNYTYVSAGDYGRIYFYNGEKLNIQKRIPGTWDSTHKATIKENAVGYYMGNPVFGLSNVLNNPALEGVYGFGNYDEKYVKAMSLDYPLPTNEFTGVDIGCLMVNGADMYVAYKTVTDVGIAKIDSANKYATAYIESMMLTSLQDRNEDSMVEGVCVDYITLPAGTSIAISAKTKYDTSYVSQAVVTDTDKMTVKTKANLPKVVNLQVKIDLISTGNYSPEIENIGIL